MGNVQHTPGPWLHAGRKGGWDGVTSASGTDICHLEFNNPANATLIAAAPDMLAALKDARSALAMLLGPETIGSTSAAHAWAAATAADAKVRAAIAKAEA